MKKKIYYWMIAAILVCGASVFTSCSKDDDDSAQPNSAEILKGVPAVCVLEFEHIIPI